MQSRPYNRLNPLAESTPNDPTVSLPSLSRYSADADTVSFLGRRSNEPSPLITYRTVSIAPQSTTDMYTDQPSTENDQRREQQISERINRQEDRVRAMHNELSRISEERNDIWQRQLRREEDERRELEEANNQPHDRRE